MFSFNKAGKPIATLYNETSQRPLAKIHVRSFDPTKKGKSVGIDAVLDIFDDDENDDSDYDDDESCLGFRPIALQRGNFDHYEVPNGTYLAPLFGDERVTLFIAGPHGCGKSYYIGHTFLPTYVKTRPQRPIFLVTAITEKDRHFAGFNINKIRLDEETLRELTLDQLRHLGKQDNGCLIIFDDVDRIRDKKTSQACYKLLDDCLSNGRDHANQDGRRDIDVVMTSHEINDYQKTKNVQTECEYVVLFPSATVPHQMVSICKKIGIMRKTKTKVLNYKSDRSVLIHKSYPMYAISSVELFTLK